MKRNDARGAKGGPRKNPKVKLQYYLVNNTIQEAKLQYYLVNNTIQNPNFEDFCLKWSSRAVNNPIQRGKKKPVSAREREARYNCYPLPTNRHHSQLIGPTPH